ncbi:MAG: Jag N-terminal domain-containing protein [Elusimicrobia bacterium]|nr:Jag N-terminal domain-containing protein [Elusimicrobiota bacterium]
MREIQIEGKDVQEAVEKGLRQLGLRRDQVEVVVLHEGSSGFLGIGSKPASVSIREKKWMGDQRASRSQELSAGPVAVPSVPSDIPMAIEEAKIVVREILGLMAIPMEGMEARWDSEQSRVKVNVSTPEGSLLVGRDGRCLESLQFLVTLIVSRKMKNPVAVQVDALGYWQRREERILTHLRQVIEEVKRTGKAFRLEPMEASLRRWVHKHLVNHPDIETASEGEGPWRKVVLKPRKR